MKLDDILDQECNVRDQVWIKPAYAKGGVGRTMFVSKRMKREIRNFIKSLPALPALDAPLLITQKGRTFTPNTLCQLFGELYRYAGIDGASSHSGRRSFITKLAYSGISAKVIMELAGHKNLSTTQRYIEVNDEMKRATVEVI